MKPDGRHFILNEEHVAIPVDLMTWARWVGDPATERHVGLDVIGQYEISTVFMGLDHSWNGAPAILFETMVFFSDWVDTSRRIYEETGKYEPSPEDPNELEGYQDRYSTWELALEGHRAACRMVADKIDAVWAPPDPTQRRDTPNRTANNRTLH